MSKRPAAAPSPRPKAKPGAKGRHNADRAPTQRQLRVAEEIRHVLAGVFTRAEFRDPDLAGVVVTVTEVRISPDLRNATAFVTRLGRSDVDKLLPNLNRVALYLRGVVAKELRLRMAPQLSFVADTSIDYAMHVSELLAQPKVARDLGHSPDRDQTHE